MNPAPIIHAVGTVVLVRLHPYAPVCVIRCPFDAVGRVMVSHVCSHHNLKIVWESNG